jgi:hypothetical protein
MSFNADTFLNQTASGPMSTSVTPCPEGEYRAIIDDGDKAITFSSGTNKNGNAWHKMNVSMKILDENVKALLKRESVFVPMQLWLDLNADESGLDTAEGKNVSLGRLRAVLDQNSGDWKPSDLKGKGPIMVKVTQRSDTTDPTIKYAEVSRVAKIS